MIYSVIVLLLAAVGAALAGWSLATAKHRAAEAKLEILTQVASIQGKAHDEGRKLLGKERDLVNALRRRYESLAGGLKAAF